MPSYVNLAATATRLLASFGRAVTITQLELAVENLTTGMVTRPAVESKGVGVLLDFDYRHFGEGFEILRSVGRTDKRLLLAPAANLEPQDLITFDGDQYKIVVMKSVAPAGIRVLYDVWIQK